MSLDELEVFMREFPFVNDTECNDMSFWNKGISRHPDTTCVSSPAASTPDLICFRNLELFTTKSCWCASSDPDRVVGGKVSKTRGIALESTSRP